MAATVRLRAGLRGADTLLDVELQGTGGQVLVNPCCSTSAESAGAHLARQARRKDADARTSIRFARRTHSRPRGQGRVDLAGDFPALHGDFSLRRVHFPAAFTSYAQILLATSVLGDAVDQR